MTERSPEATLEITRAFIAERFPDCLLAILAGSIVRGVQRRLELVGGRLFDGYRLYS